MTERAGDAVGDVLGAEGRPVARMTPALQTVPAVVEAQGRACRVKIDLLPGVLADVADVDVAGCAVEGEAPRVAQPDGPNLVGACLADEGVIGRDGVGVASIDVEAQDCPQQRRGVLTVLLGVAAAAAVAQPDVEIAVGSEEDLPTVVVALGLVHRQDRLRTGRVQRIGLGV